MMSGVSMAHDLSELKVLIIGAGASGLAAARELLSHKCRVTVLEARDRVGGRIHTVEVGGNKVDMGASWIHGIGPNAEDLPRWKRRYNPIYQLAKDNKIQTVPTWDNETNTKISFYWNKTPGKRLDDSLIDDLFDRIDEHVDQSVPFASIHTSVEDILEDFEYGSTPDSKEIYDAVANFMYCQVDGAELSDMAAKYFDEVWKFDGEEHVFPDGYKQIIDILSKDVNIQLNKVVTTIDYTQDKVVVDTSDGQIYIADKVIVTVPLGVLKADSIKFIPNLSKEKERAINRLGMGLMDKLCLEFPEAFWKKDKDSDWICYASDTPGLWVDTLNVHKYFGKPLIVMFNIGKAAIQMSSLTDEEVLESAMKAIRNWYPNAPKYVNYVRSNWGKDPYSRGSYPFVKVGATLEDFDYYREFDSTQERIFFAGDGTVKGMIGCVHAAYISGVDSANFAMFGHKYEYSNFSHIKLEESRSKFKEMLYILPGLIFLLLALIVPLIFTL